ncbi:MAG: hypothetical protein EOP10_25615 [Proteobacteria bacterium]|nr:MAG: hypothetical protein EOP10_25615 [Pseudomonadota bacterium]
MALLEWDQFLERVEHNESLALELANDLLLGLDGRVDALEFSIAQGLPKGVELAAHSLRGLLAPYGSRELLLILKGIEEQARAGKIELSALPIEIGLMVNELKNELALKISSIEGTGLSLNDSGRSLYDHDHLLS